MSLYLVNQHPILGTFDADLFVQDLVAQQLRYCSPLLVNAVLYYACVRHQDFTSHNPKLMHRQQAYTVFDISASHLSYAFYNESRKIWQADQSSDSLVNVAALQIMCLAGSCNGHDQEGIRFFHLSQDMAERLQVEDEHSSQGQTPQLLVDPYIDDDLRFRSHIIWGCFMIGK